MHLAHPPSWSHRLSIQPQLTARHEDGFWADVWAQVDGTDENDAEWDFAEVDFTLGYDWDWCEWDFTIGGTHYTFPAIDGAESTTEIFGWVTYNSYPFSPYVGIYYDVDEVEGYYLYGGASHTFPERNDPTMDFWLGYGDATHNLYYFGQDTDGAIDANLDFSMTFMLDENWTLVPHVTATTLLDEDVTGDIVDDFFVHGGLSAIFSWD